MLTSPSLEPGADLDIQWLSWRRYGSEIAACRRASGRTADDAEALALPAADEGGLHLGAFANGRLLAVVSVHVFRNVPEALASRQLPSGSGTVIHYSGLAFRESDGDAARVQGPLLGILQFMVVSLLRPDRLYVSLPAAALASRGYLQDVLHLRPLPAAGSTHTQGAVLYIDDPREVVRSLQSARREYHAVLKRLATPPPSLVRHLEAEGMLALIDMDRFNAENNYTQPLSLKDELPRLAAQTRLLIPEQRSRLESVQFPSPPAQLLDLGAGPGVYLSALAKEPRFEGYSFTAMDLAKEMVTVGRLSHPKFRWLQASAYTTGEPDNSYDVVHSNFLFIHLRSPDLALREVVRILKPGGLLYIFDINDSTFECPSVLLDLVERHGAIQEGDRKVLDVLPGLAQQHGLEQLHSFSSQVTNRAPGAEAVFAPGRIDLPRASMWGVVSFFGQRSEIREQFEAAQSHYFSSGCDFAVSIQTHVYRKPSA